MQDNKGPHSVVTGGGTEAFVTFAQGRLKVFNSAKNFGFISPIFRNEDSEGPPLKMSSDDGLWFFGNHNLAAKTQPGVVLSFEVWENSEGKPQARGVQLATEQATVTSTEVGVVDSGKGHQIKRHQNEPRVIYPSVYISDVPVEFTEDTLRELHKNLGLNPDTIMGLKFLPFTEVSLGVASNEAKQVAPVTGSVILRYINEEAANAACDRLKGHPIRTSTGVTKYLGARHAAPAKWMMERKVQEDEDKRATVRQGEAMGQKVRGMVARVSAAGYGVIKSHEWGEVMWRQYELPTNLRSLQFADPQRFAQEVQSRPDYKRLKDMEGKEVEAELYRLPDGQLRASYVRPLDSPESLTDRGQTPPPPPRPPSQLANEAYREKTANVVCVHPVPPQWTDVELRERFEWYGNLEEVAIERRVVNENNRRRGQSQRDSNPALSVGVLRFREARSAEEVIRTEHGGSLERNGSPVVVEAGQSKRSVGWCDGVVMRYLTGQGLGLLRSSQVEGDVHFEAPTETRMAGLDLQGMRIDAKVEYGSDGSPQAKEVRMKPELADMDGHRRGGKGHKGQMPDGSSMMPMGKGGMLPGGMPPLDSGGGTPGWGPNDPWYKTQPCPYHRQGMCQMGQNCYFAHAPEELRPAPEAMMMNHFARMMGQQVPKKKKDKDKKIKAQSSGDRDRKRSRKTDGARSDDSEASYRGLHSRAVSRSNRDMQSGSPRRAHTPGRSGHTDSSMAGARKRHRIELDDADF